MRAPCSGREPCSWCSRRWPPSAAAAAAAAAVGASGTGKDTILQVGSTYNIDSLNPFTANEPQAYNAFIMEYPELVQYGPGLKLEGDWAKSWDQPRRPDVDVSPDPRRQVVGQRAADRRGRRVDDRTALKYKDGATSYFAGALLGVEKVEAPDPNTLVITYSKPVAGALANLEQLYILPKHVWEKYTGNNGKAL